MLVLPSWAGMNISLFFGMRVWDFAPLCWPFLHTVFDFVYFWIFGVFRPKGQMGFNFVNFPKFGVFTSFCVPPCFLRFFFVTMWVMDLDDPFGYQSDHFCMFCCIGMRVAPVLPTLCSVE